MPGLVPGIHVLNGNAKDMDGRVKSGHDEGWVQYQKRWYQYGLSPLMVTRRPVRVCG
jgi:hypothetical protein